MPTRTRKHKRAYKKHLRSEHANSSCIFCDIDEAHEQFILETESFKVITNIFPYAEWDGQKVTDHLMIVPKKHTDTLNDLEADEAIEYMNLIGSYESHGYNVYARAPHSSIKSVIHQHTHLIKLAGKNKNLLSYISKPYWRIVR